MTANEIIEVLKQVSSYDAGKPYKIKCYGNQFLLQKEDIDTLLNYIKRLETNIDTAISLIKHTPILYSRQILLELERGKEQCEKKQVKTNDTT